MPLSSSYRTILLERFRDPGVSKYQKLVHSDEAIFREPTTWASCRVDILNGTRDMHGPSKGVRISVTGNASRLLFIPMLSTFLMMKILDSKNKDLRDLSWKSLTKCHCPRCYFDAPFFESKNSRFTSEKPQARLAI